MRLDDLQIPVRQRCRRLAQQARQHRNAEAEVGGAQDRDALASIGQARFQRSVHTGGAADQGGAVRQAMIERQRQRSRAAEVDDDVERRRLCPVVCVPQRTRGAG